MMKSSMLRATVLAAASGAIASAAAAGGSSLEPGADARLARVVAAHGVQIYECRQAAAEPVRYEWVFVAPQADLFDERGLRIGSHGAGPHWLADDGSRIVGAVTARAEAPTGGAIPWLLLVARSTGAEGAFSDVSHIQRIHTVGGTAPSGGCDRDAQGRTAAVAYRADYRFFTSKRTVDLPPQRARRDDAAPETGRPQGVGGRRCDAQAAKSGCAAAG